MPRNTKTSLFFRRIITSEFLLCGLGWATAFLFPVTGDITSSKTSLSILPVKVHYSANFFFAYLALKAVLCVVGACLLWGFTKLEGFIRSLLLTILMFTLWLPGSSSPLLELFHLNYIAPSLNETHWVLPFTIKMLFIFVIAYIVVKRFSNHKSTLNRTMTSLLFVWAFVGIADFIKVFQNFRDQGGTEAYHAHFEQVSQRSGSRLLWLIFDELQYSYLFEPPEKADAFPNFKKLRANSFFATAAISPADRTRLSIPSYIHGTTLSAQTSEQKDLSYLRVNENELLDMKAPTNIFARLKARGLSTGVVGWHFPYCHFFKENLDFCHYQLNVEIPSEPGFAQNVLNLTKYAIMDQALVYWPRTPEVFADLLGQAEEKIAKDDLDFLLVHLNLPHLPQIARGPNSEPGFQTINPPDFQYESNLKLADKVLGTLLTLINLDEVNIVVTSDHALRIRDEIVDPRIPFMFHLAKENGHQLEFSRSFNTIVAADLVYAVASRTIDNYVNLGALIQGNAKSYLAMERKKSHRTRE